MVTLPVYCQAVVYLTELLPSIKGQPTANEKQHPGLFTEADTASCRALYVRSTRTCNWYRGDQRTCNDMPAMQIKETKKFKPRIIQSTV